jgi:hypothetical protein
MPGYIIGEDVCAAEQFNNSTMQPSLTGFSKTQSDEGRNALTVFSVVIEGVLETIVGSTRTLIEPNLIGLTVG